MVDRSSLLDAVGAGGSTAAVMQRIVGRAIELIPGADGSALELVQGEELVCVAAGGSLEHFAGTRVDLYSSFSGRAVLGDSTLRCDDIRSDRRVERDATWRAGALSMICVPLHRGARPIGLLKVSSRAASAFSGRDAATLGQLAEFVGATVAASREVDRSLHEVIAPAASDDPHAPDVEGISSFVAHVIDPRAAHGAEAAERVRVVLEQELIKILLQPILDLSTMLLAGAEALTRVQLEPALPTPAWFAEARRAGLGGDLQLLAARKALRAASSLPASAFVAINLDVEGVGQPALVPMLAGAGRQVVIELTEEVKVDDYRGLRDVLTRLRRGGVRLAIDDTGAGYASLSHVVKLAPDLIKLDMELICGIDVDPVRRSLVTAVATFAAETGSQVVAEGIETKAELDAVRELGVGYGQGYLLGRPAAPELLSLELAGLSSALD